MSTASQASPRSANRHLIVLANPSQDSFDHSIAETYRRVAEENHQQVVIRDLYALQFNPVLSASERPTENGEALASDVAAELEHLRAADILVLVYPIWFGLPPAMLKGYVDRVLGAGYSFRDLRAEKGQPTVSGKPLLSFTTSGLPLPWLSEQGQPVSLQSVFDRYLRKGLGMSRTEHVEIDSVTPDMNPCYAAEQLHRVQEAAQSACAMLASGRYRQEAEAALERRSLSGKQQ